MSDKARLVRKLLLRSDELDPPDEEAFVDWEACAWEPPTWTVPSTWTVMPLPHVDWGGAVAVAARTERRFGPGCGCRGPGGSQIPA
jgi:hypothetical protein